MADIPPDHYKIKRISFFGREVPIFLQNLNGPCPLLAIANILSLRNQLQIPPAHTSLSQSRLISTVAEQILDANRLGDAPTPIQANLRQNIADCLDVLGKLATGIDVNVRFHSPTGFEATKEVTIFDLLDITLMHGWLVDPQDTETVTVIGQRSYNELVDYLVANMDATTLNSMESIKSRSRRWSGVVHTPQISLPVTADASATPVAPIPQSSDLASPKLPNSNDVSSTVEGLAVESESQNADTARVIDDIISQLVDLVAAGSANTSPMKQATLQQGSTAYPLEDLGSFIGTETHMEAAEVANTASTPSSARVIGTSAFTAPTSQLVDILADAAPTAYTPPAVATPAIQHATPKNSEEAWHKAQVLRNFLESNASQLTVYGLTAMLDALRDNQLAAFFRNNHFAVVFKYQHLLYLLVTDQGYLSEPGVVWERLDTVDNDTTLCTCEFLPYTAPPTPPPPSATQVPGGDLSDADAAAIAALLQEDEQALAATRLVQADQQVTTYQPQPQQAAGIPVNVAPQSPDVAQGVPVLSTTQHSNSSHQIDADLALALRLQEEEDREAARQQQLQQQQQRQSGSQVPLPTQQQRQAHQPASHSAPSRQPQVNQAGHRGGAYNPSYDQQRRQHQAQYQQYQQQHAQTHGRQTGTSGDRRPPGRAGPTPPPKEESVMDKMAEKCCMM